MAVPKRRRQAGAMGQRGMGSYGWSIIITASYDVAQHSKRLLKQCRGIKLNLLHNGNHAMGSPPDLWGAHHSRHQGLQGTPDGGAGVGPGRCPHTTPALWQRCSCPARICPTGPQLLGACIPQSYMQEAVVAYRACVAFMYVLQPASFRHLATICSNALCMLL